MKPLRCGLAFLCVVVLGACSSDWPRLDQPGAGIAFDLPDSATCGSRRDDSPAGPFVGRFCAAELDPENRFAQHNLEVLRRRGAAAAP